MEDYNKEIKEIMDETYETPPELEVEQRSSAPLFVKVDKYREMLIGVQEIKLFVSGVKQTFGILQELENVRNDALRIMKATVQRLEKSVIEIDSGLLKPRGVDMSDLTQGEGDMKQLEDSLTDLQDQLKEIKRDLTQIS